MTCLRFPQERSEAVYEGDCLCGEIKVRVNCSIESFDMCFCNTCQKTHASAFTTGVSIKTEDFEIIKGKDSFSKYESSPGVFRWFCSNCGTHIYKTNDDKSHLVRLRPAILNNFDVTSVNRVLFEKNKPDWFLFDVRDSK